MNFSFFHTVYAWIITKAKAVLNKKDQCFLVGGYRDGEGSKSINMFDPIKGIINVQGELSIGRYSHIAVLLWDVLFN